MPRPSSKLRLLPLIAATYFMVSGGPYGLEDIIGDAGYARALLLLLLVPVLWSLPTSLMIGELATSIPADGGFYHWVRRALGPFWGFQEAWLSLAASVFDMAIYPTTFVLYLSHLAPALTAGYRGLFLKLAIVTLAALWNLRGAVAVGRGSIRLMLVSLSPFVVLVSIVAWRILRHTAIPAPSGPPAHLDLSGALLVAMWNYMGWDNASTIAQEVEDPQHTYPRAMLSSALAVMGVYLLPLAAVWIVGIPAARFSTGAWVDAALLLGGPVLAFTVVAAGSLDGLGTFNALVLSYTRLPAAMADDGLLPRVLSNAAGPTMSPGSASSPAASDGRSPSASPLSASSRSTSSSTAPLSCSSSSPSLSSACASPPCRDPSASRAAPPSRSSSGSGPALLIACSRYGRRGTSVSQG